MREAGPDDLPAVVALMSRRLPQVPPAELGYPWAHPEVFPDLLTLLAEDDGALVGVGRLGRPTFMPPDWSVLNVTVAPGAEGGGVGSALHGALLARCEPGLAELRVAVQAHEERAVAIARHWGFEVQTTSIESELDLTDAALLPAPAPPPGVDLEDLATFDVPDRDGVEAMLRASQTHPEARAGIVVDLDLLRTGSTGEGMHTVAVLARVDGAPAGLTVGSVAEGRLFIDYTGVDPTFRGRGIARLLKQRAHLDAAAAGATSSRTANAEHNHGIRRLNAELGYQVTLALHRMRRVLTDDGRTR